MSKAVFEVKESGGAFANASSGSEEKKYLGPERRRVHRREGIDRRAEVRFDINSSERRVLMGRRSDDAVANFW